MDCGDSRGYLRYLCGLLSSPHSLLWSKEALKSLSSSTRALQVPVRMGTRRGHGGDTRGQGGDTKGTGRGHEGTAPVPPLTVPSGRGAAPLRRALSRDPRGT